jgi:serine/threonine protein kinase
LPADVGSPETDRAGLKARRMVGHYRLERALDASALVWLAADEAGVPYVLKTGPRASIHREFDNLSAARHPNIVAARELVESGADSFIVLEYLAGGDLVSLAGFAPKHWLGPLEDVIEALGFLHSHGIAHRDLKARNVLLGSDGRARLTDLGSAREVGSRFSLGGTTAAAVEPNRGDGPVAAADDVYALACLVHELLFGMPPQSGLAQEAPESAAPLAGLVRACLEPPLTGPRPDLRDFRAVVKSMRKLQRDLG